MIRQSMNESEMMPEAKFDGSREGGCDCDCDCVCTELAARGERRNERFNATRLTSASASESAEPLCGSSCCRWSSSRRAKQKPKHAKSGVVLWCKSWSLLSLSLAILVLSSLMTAVVDADPSPVADAGRGSVDFRLFDLLKPAYANDTPQDHHSSEDASFEPLAPARAEHVESERHAKGANYVSDDAQQYEKAARVLAAAAAAAAKRRTSGEGLPQHRDIGTMAAGGGGICPKDCRCLNDYFDCARKQLDKMVPLPSYVQVLDYTGNKLNDTTVLGIANLQQLRKLFLKRNLLTVMPKFTGLTGLKTLGLAGNRIQQISSDALASLPELRVLDLSRNNIHLVDKNCFPKWNFLTNILLSSNEISVVTNSAFQNLGSLVDLDLSHNYLVNLPIGVFDHSVSLRKLTLDENQLELNWSTFRGLALLEKLSLKSNNLRTLPDGVFYVMNEIQMINLNNNDITSLSRQGFYNLTKLKHLSVSNNSIARIEPDTFEFTQGLVTLDLSYNNITEFKPNHLDCLKQLRNLNLGHNKIQYLPENVFECTRGLEDLNLRRNRLAWIIEDQSAPPPFKVLHKLKRLDLYGNNLKQISSKSFYGLNNLELLNIGGNPLATIQTGTFQYMSQLQKLVFRSLNFICDCDIAWFQSFLQTKFTNPKFQENAVCGYPEKYLDRSVVTLSKSELQCVASPKPVLKKEPSNILAVNGANLTLECAAMSPAAASLAAADELKIKWRHNNQNVRERSFNGGRGSYGAAETQIRHDQKTNQTIIFSYLRMYNVSYEDAGKYQCVVSNAFGTTYSRKFELSIGIRPTFEQTPSNITINSGETARLVCSAVGDPKPEISLQKFGSTDFPAALERRLQVMREENVFIVTNSKPSDSGIYTCTAESAAGEIKVNASLTVNDKPRPIIPLLRKEIVEGKECVLKCINEDVAADLIQPRREWYKDNKPFHISATSNSEGYYFTNDKELLIIVNAKSQDAGQYQCDLSDNSKTLILQMEVIVVQSVNLSMITIGVVIVSLVCTIIGSCIVWCFVSYQKRQKPNLNAHHRQGSIDSHDSKLDQTQLTTLNRTALRPIPTASVHEDHDDREEVTYSQTNLSVNNAEHAEQKIGLIAAATPSYQQRIAVEDEDGLALNYIRGNALENGQQDHLSSKDSGTGSDAAGKRSMEDFAITIPTQMETATPTSGSLKSRKDSIDCQTSTLLNGDHADNEYQNANDGDGDGVSDGDDDSDIEPTKSYPLGIPVVYDDVNRVHHPHLGNHISQIGSRSRTGIVGLGGLSNCSTALAKRPLKFNVHSSTNYNQSSTSTDI